MPSLERRGSRKGALSNTIRPVSERPNEVMVKPRESLSGFVADNSRCRYIACEANIGSRSTKMMKENILGRKRKMNTPHSDQAMVGRITHSGDV